MMRLPDEYHNRSRSSDLTLPWEEGYASLVLGNSSPNGLELPLFDLQPDRAVVEPLVADGDELPTAGLPQVAKRRRIHALGRVKADPREELVRKWSLTLDEFKLENLTGRLAEAAAPLGPGGLAHQLDHCFAHMATATISKRWYAVRRYARWRRSHQDGGRFWQEDAVYDYLRNLEVTGAPATRGIQLLEAVGFMQSTIGLDAAQSINASGRCKGLALKMVQRKRNLKQAPPLSVATVMHLDKMVAKADRVVDRVAAGNFLMCSFASARYDDLQRSGQLHLDINDDGIGLIRTSVLEHKTFQRTKSQKQLLPLMAITRGLATSKWATDWIKARRDAGLQDGDGAALFTPSDSETFSRIPTSTGMATTWLRDLLAEMGGSQDAVNEVSSYSLKTTLLTWAARYGMSVEDRRLMGHHLDPHVKFVATYNRDLLVNVQVKIAHMLGSMRRGSFDPEATAGQRIAEASLDDLFNDGRVGSQEHEDDVVLTHTELVSVGGMTPTS